MFLRLARSYMQSFCVVTRSQQRCVRKQSTAAYYKEIEDYK